MDEIHVADLADGGLQRGVAGQHAVAALAAAVPVQAQPLAVVVEQLLDADLAHHARSRRCSRPAPRLAEQRERGRRRSPRGASLSRNVALREHLRELGQQLQVQVGGLLGHEQHEYLRHRLAVGRVEGYRLASGAANAPRASLSPLMRPCGIAMPWPSPVEPSFSRAARLRRDRGGIEAGARREQCADRFEQPRLRRDVEIEHDVGARGSSSAIWFIGRATVVFQPPEMKRRAVSAPDLPPAMG